MEFKEVNYGAHIAAVLNYIILVLKYLQMTLIEFYMLKSLIVKF